MKCNDYLEDLSAYTDGVLDTPKKLALEAHLANCEACREELDMLIKIKVAVQDMTTVQLPEDFHKDLMARLSVETQSVKQPKRRLIPYLAVVAAAGLLVWIGGGEGTNQLDTTTQSVERSIITDESVAEMAIEEASDDIPMAAEVTMGPVEGNVVEVFKDEIWQVGGTVQDDTYEGLKNLADTYAWEVLWEADDVCTVKLKHIEEKAILEAYISDQLNYRIFCEAHFQTHTIRLEFGN